MTPKSLTEGMKGIVAVKAIAEAWKEEATRLDCGFKSAGLGWKVKHSNDANGCQRRFSCSSSGGRGGSVR